MWLGMMILPVVGGKHQVPSISRVTPVVVYSEPPKTNTFFDLASRFYHEV